MSAPICYFKNTSAVDAVNAQLALKADDAQTKQAIATKANQTALDSVSAVVNTKADQTAVDSVSAVVSTKADQSAVDSVSATVSTKADQSALDTANASLALKAKQADLESGLALKHNEADATARIAEEKKFYDAIKANIFISGPDGVTELDYTYLL
jgi:hypothetical protein